MKDKTIEILFCDDETDVIQPMIFWLEKKGYKVSAVTNGPDAVKRVKEDPPDIIFLDQNMPVMDGIETLKRIRQLNKDLPVIVLSAYVGDQEKMRALSSYGISGMFYKGLSFDELLPFIEAALRTHKKLKSN